jgi:hypothetical protein
MGILNIRHFQPVDIKKLQVSGHILEKKGWVRFPRKRDLFCRKRDQIHLDPCLLLEFGSLEVWKISRWVFFILGSIVEPKDSLKYALSVQVLVKEIRKGKSWGMNFFL